MFIIDTTPLREINLDQASGVPVSHGSIFVVQQQLRFDLISVQSRKRLRSL
jgi:hypothetical protein